MSRTCLSIVLAAGEGTRMKSIVPKVLHRVAGLPMVSHVVLATLAAGSDRVALVVGRGAEAVEAAAREQATTLAVFEQSERLGTAHATLAASAAIEEGFDDVLVLFGDSALVRPETLHAARSAIAEGAAVCVVGFRTADPTGYGRLLMEGAELAAIREERDASEAERRIDLCNGGVMAIDGRLALGLLRQVGNGNRKGEYYLTDIVELARAAGLSVRVVLDEEEALLGVNTRAELATVEAAWQKRRRRELMLGGVTMTAPETVFLAFDTQIAADVEIEPNVVFGPGVTVESGAVIHAFSHLEGAHVGPNVAVGPFARLRPGARLASGAKVGNFCEVKNADVGEGAKVNHLTYIGDASIGAGSNVGAGAITCNYDGFLKHRTVIGRDVFVGSNSSLVAPVTLGDGAYIGSGSVVTDDVPADALAIGRGRQVTKPGRARKIRERLSALKREKAAGR